MASCLLAGLAVALQLAAGAGRRPAPAAGGREAIRATLLPAHKYLVVEVEIAGRKWPMVVDTAAARTTLSFRTAGRLGLKPSALSLLPGVTGGTHTRYPASVDIKLGPRTLAGWPVEVLNMDGVFDLIEERDKLRPAGLIGSDLLASVGAVIDYPSRRLWIDLADPRSPALPGGPLLAAMLDRFTGPLTIGNWRYTIDPRLRVTAVNRNGSIRLVISPDGSRTVHIAGGGPIYFPPESGRQ